MYDLGIELFIREVMSHTDFQARIRRCMIESIELTRRNEKDRTVNLDATKQISNMLTTLSSYQQQQKISPTAERNFYENVFEKEFLKISSQYYRSLSQSWLSSKTCPEYLESADLLINSETDRCALCMDAQTLPKLEATLFTELIGRSNVAATLISNPTSGLDALMDRRCYPALGLMRRLFDRVPAAHQCMCAAVKRHVAAVGSRMTATSPAYNVFTHELLRMQQQSREFLGASFGEDVDFAQALDAGFEIFMNEYPDTSSLLARYTHELLSKGTRSSSSVNSSADEINEVAGELVALFRHIHDKDRFEMCYRRHLASRLLTGRSVSQEAERSVLSLFRAECGSQYTSKADGMFRDMQFSEDLTAKFQAYCIGRVCPVKLSAAVLSSHLWALKTPAECVLPKAVLDACALYEEFFTKEFDSRKLTWMHSLGIADVRVAITPTKVYSFLLSAHQLSILSVIFGSDSGVTVERLAGLTKLPCIDIHRCLMLFCKTRLLTCWLAEEKAELNPKQISPTLKISDNNDLFAVNKKFAYKSHRLNLATLKDSSSSPTSSSSLSISISGSTGLSTSSSLSLSSSSDVLTTSAGLGTVDKEGDAAAAEATAATAEEEAAALEEERRVLVDSAVVRVMKARRTVEHNELFSEVARQVQHRFMPDARFVKNRIEHLMEEEYVRKTHTHTYTYMCTLNNV